MSIITISRQSGSLGEQIAQSLAKKLGWACLTRETIASDFLSKVANDHELHMLKQSAKFYLRSCSEGISFIDYLSRELTTYAKTNSAVMVGFGSQMIFSDHKEALHVRVIAPESVRIARIKKQYRIADAEAAETLSRSDRKHRKFVSTVFNVDLTDDSLYDCTLNTKNLSVYDCITIVSTLYNERSLELEFERKTDHTDVKINPAEAPVLKNESEIEFARILDMYQIDWKYEPKTFPIEWDAEGNVSMAFSPDFYLTKFDTYIELTTMNQKYITKKNKKMRKLKKLYPGTNIRIVNKRDFNALIERFKT